MGRIAVFVAFALFALASTASAQTPPIPTCGVVTRAPPYLTRYDELSTAGARYRVRLRYDGASHAWTPAPALRMPLHHASSLEYVGFTLPPGSQLELELEITAVDRRLVSFEAGVRTWFFAYRVHVASACTRAH